MTIYVEVTKTLLRVMISDELLEVKLPADFYRKTSDGRSYKMFLDNKVNGQISKFIFKHRSKLPFFQKLLYVLFRNEVWVLADDYAQRNITGGVLHAYTTLAFDGREVGIINKPLDFDSTTLSDIELMKDKYIRFRGKDSEKLLSDFR
jgi:hypothetical protein